MNRGSCNECENRGDYFAYNCKDINEAWDIIVEDYPEVKNKYKKDDLTLTFMSQCLGCGWYNIEPTDDMCGDCGEFRVSKRKIKCYYLKSNK